MTPGKSISVNAAELRDAFEFVSAGLLDEHIASISIDTGRIDLASSLVETEEQVPDDLETSDHYIAVQHKNELGLGRDLALSFTERELPGDYDIVAGFFRRKGAYGRFKQLLELRGMLDKWYDFENTATEEALSAWCEASGIQVFNA